MSHKTDLDFPSHPSHGGKLGSHSANEPSATLPATVTEIPHSIHKTFRHLQKDIFQITRFFLKGHHPEIIGNQAGQQIA